MSEIPPLKTGQADQRDGPPPPPPPPHRQGGSPTALGHDDRAQWVHITYGLYAATFVLAIGMLIGVVFAYIKRGEQAPGDLYFNHYTWLIRTFWMQVVLFLVSLVVWIIGLGWLINGLAAILLVWRIVRGWLLFKDRRDFPDVTAYA